MSSTVRTTARFARTSNRAWTRETMLLGRSPPAPSRAMRFAAGIQTLDTRRDTPRGLLNGSQHVDSAVAGIDRAGADLERSGTDERRRMQTWALLLHTSSGASLVEQTVELRKDVVALRVFDMTGKAGLLRLRRGRRAVPAAHWPAELVVGPAFGRSLAVFHRHLQEVNVAGIGSLSGLA